jgi:hypothetical protein
MKLQTGRRLPTHKIKGMIDSQSGEANGIESDDEIKHGTPSAGLWEGKSLAYFDPLMYPRQNTSATCDVVFPGVDSIKSLEGGE